MINTQKGVALIAIIIIAVLVLGGGAAVIKNKNAAKKAEREKNALSAEPDNKMMNGNVPSAIQVKFTEQNGSGVSGQAVLTQIGTSTVKVIVNTTGKPSGIAQPAHIHVGSCPNPGAVKYPLTSIDRGASQTEIQTTLSALLTELPLAINVHKSAAETGTLVACGDITAERGMMQSGGMIEEKGMMDEKKGGSMMNEAKEEMGSMMKEEMTVRYGANGFSPRILNIKVGQVVRFVNETGKPASIASDPHPVHTAYAEFDQWKTNQRGQNEFRFTFEKAGTWTYHDHLNPGMTGTVIVK